MPLSLNTSHPLYGNLKLLIGVDDDNVLKDLVTPARTITPRAQSSYGSGTYGRHFRTGPSPSSSSGASLSFKPGSNYGTLLVVTNGVTSATAGEECGFINAPAGSIDESTIPRLGHYPTTGKIVLRALDTTSGVTRTSGPTTEAAVGSGARSWVGTASATSYAVYVDGQLDNSGSWTLVANTRGEFVNIGVIPGFSVLDSNIVWIAWFDKVLSAAEVESLHASLGAGNQFGLVGSGAPPTPPSGTVTIGTITPSTTSASVPYSYSGSDATGFEYRLNGGAATTIGASPATISGLTAGTPYSIEVRAINSTGPGAWSAVANFTTESENTSPSFTGPNIADISGTEAVALTPVDVSSLFFDAESGLTFSAVGSWPAGVTVSSAGVISGTPTTAGTYSGLQVRATDAGALTADSNAFSITVAAAALPSTITVTEPLKNNTGTLLANVSGVRVAVLEAATLAGVFETSGLTTSASGLLAAITDAAITTGQQYHVAIKLADGSVGITGPITAS